MLSQVNSILIHESDNVATAIVELHKGDLGLFVMRGEMAAIAIAENIPQYHKFAVVEIPRTELVRKYGEAIGQAICDIPPGTHVHVHNIVSPEGRR
jgi:altronate dehydratase small subunit